MATTPAKTTTATEPEGRRGLRIALIGSRGIPAGYSGFETFAEETCTRLVELGHDVTVYCRKGAMYTEDVAADEYKGVKLVYTPFLKQRELETLSHEFLSILDSLRRPFDLYYFLGTRSAPLYVPLRLSKRIVVVNTDGLEWKRRKWNRLGRAYLRFAEWVAARVAADYLVSDAQAIEAYFLRTYGRESEYLTNGAYVMPDDHLGEGDLDQWDVRRDDYYLVACRIEPENNIDIIIKEFIASGSTKTLAIAGGMNYETPYWTHLQELGKGQRVKFLGPVYGPQLVEKLHLGAYGYVHGHEVGGTNPALLKGMGCGNLVLALGSEFNIEVLGGTGVIWSKRPGSLAERIRWAEAHPEMRPNLGERARQRIRDHYTWDKIARDHDAWFRKIARQRGFAV